MGPSYFNERKGQSRRLQEAEHFFARALQISPNNFKTNKTLLLSMRYNPKYDEHAIFSEHLRVARKFAEPLSVFVLPHTNQRIVSRRLKIGYVSPDFRKHSVAYFIEPVLSAHNRELFEVFCYSNADLCDDTTERLKNSIDHWRDIRTASDEKAAEIIRNDKIDILIDLAGHSANSRILLFARRPAPVQVSWIGYPATTGLSAMDYKIVDNYTDPPGMTDQFYTEKLIRMPESFLCYLPDKESPDVGPLPALSSGHITFGSFNIFAKVNPEVIDLWARIFAAVPDAHLVIKAKSLSDRTTRKHVTDILTRKGLETDRVELLGWEPSIKRHLELYNRIDIALDTFPYNGTTTTCEALWMGVPVITLAGRGHASRVGVNLLSNVGIPELVARTSEEYLSIAVNLASDLKRLRYLREHLRDMMTLSPLCDAKRFTANLEICYRKMWETWCQSV